eukprot:Seg11358.1 transcript_id=Seg11358.1/GoldUCD/mRNA.D3Y31 product="CREB/ATF bZIP transcription factor" protein_id=Seg11358.1/GoldUCD/D3Y31
MNRSKNTALFDHEESVQSLGLAFADFDSEMEEFRDDFISFVDTKTQDFGLGVSPAHSSDSGVDVVVDDLLGFDSKLTGEGRFSAEWECLEEGDTQMDIDELDGFLHSGLIDVEGGDEVGGWEEKEDCSGNEEGSGNDGNGSREEKDDEKGGKCYKQQLSVTEDHCYTNKELPVSEVQETSVQEARIYQPSSQARPNARSRKSFDSERAEDDFEFQQQKKKTNIEDDEIDLEEAMSNPDKCNNRNAIMARLNRQRKKRYVNNLESEVSSLRKENTSLLSENRNLKGEISSCKEELAYLKNVLANQSMLSSVIKAVSCVPGVNISGVVPSNDTNDHDTMDGAEIPKMSGTSEKSKRQRNQNSWQANAKTGLGASSNAGICLHVSQENVSVEFCQHCSKHAKKSA